MWCVPRRHVPLDACPAVRSRAARSHSAVSLGAFPSERQPHLPSDTCPRPGCSLFRRRYAGGLGNRCRWADRFAMSEQRQSMERHFQRSRELFRTDRGRPCPREWKDPQAKRCGRMERSGSMCGRGYRSAEAAAAASGSSCELANPAQVCQIASQTGVLFSAG